MDHTTLTPTDRRILAARTTLAERCAALEDRVTDTVEKARGTVDHATSEVRSTVSDATKSVSSLFSRTTEDFHGVLDLRRQVRDNPWQGILLAVGAGLAARIFSNRKTTAPLLETGTPAPNPIAELVGIVRRELVGLGETAVTAASKRLRENIVTLATPSETTQRQVASSGFERNGSH